MAGVQHPPGAENQVIIAVNIFLLVMLVISLLITGASIYYGERKDAIKYGILTVFLLFVLLLPV
jgi:hypothetical protein